MKTTTIAIVVTAAMVSFSAASAQAGGWGSGKKGGSLINVSPSVQTGGILNGFKVLNNAPILSGTAILSGNQTGILNGSLNGTLNNIGVGILSGNKAKKRR